MITIGLGTITYNKDVTALVMAAGEAKAGIVKAAVESAAHNQVPASVLHGLPGACFYLTASAASTLQERRHLLFEQQPRLDEATRRPICIEAALGAGRSLEQLTETYMAQNRSGALFLTRLREPLATVGLGTRTALEHKLERALAFPRNDIFLHTAPHWKNEPTGSAGATPPIFPQRRRSSPFVNCVMLEPRPGRD